MIMFFMSFLNTSETTNRLVDKLQTNSETRKRAHKTEKKHVLVKNIHWKQNTSKTDIQEPLLKRLALKDKQERH